MSRTRTLDEIYAAALDALASALGVDRSAILLFDGDAVMRFKAWRGLSDAYRAAVEGHSPWPTDATDAPPLIVADVRDDAGLAPFRTALDAEGIAALAFIPLMSADRVIGKFMLYYAVPTRPSAEALQLAAVIAAQVAFAIERMRAESAARRNEERLRFALDAASMGTWDWDLASNHVVWSDNLERIHGLPPGTFDGTFASYEREIHPEDRERVLASARRALTEGVPHDVEYRIVAPDGTVRWCEGKGRVEYEDGRPVRMTGVCMMVTRRKQAELARLSAAEEAARAKDEFLATLSHELRTPLNVMLGWIQMLEGQLLPPDRHAQALAVIGRNARLQAALIEDILDVSRIITGKLELERGPVAIAPLVASAVDGVTPAAEARRLTLAVHVDDPLPTVEADGRRLQQVLGNVLSNAIKFTPEGGRVEVDVRAEVGWLTLRVRDTGVGIAPDFLPHVFDRFRQADSRASRRHGGLGLGLAIARHLVEQHGGQIAAASDGPGTGTTITLRLPVVDVTHGTAAPPAAAPFDARLAGRTVLVVDDEPDSRELVAMLLRLHGADVVTCASALEALTCATSRPVDLLVADIGMPGVDGYELMRRARAQGIEVASLAVTAYARPEERERALAAGFGGHIAKPIDADAFIAAAVQALLTREHRDGAAVDQGTSRAAAARPLSHAPSTREPAHQSPHTATATSSATSAPVSSGASASA